jgi:major membrane immunogen (membrane-anchored lipoprotein)
MEAQTTPPTPIRRSSQTAIPGTEVGSAELRELHEEYATAKYQAKEAQERAKAVRERLIETMEAEEVDAISCDIEYGEEVRRCVTRLVESKKLKSKLEKDDD